MSKHTLYKNLSCDLTAEEIAVYSQELAANTAQQAEIEAEKKEVLSNFTARLNKCVADGRMLARKIITKKEDRQVECGLDFDYARGMVYTVRLDTGVTIGQRKLTDDERQERLDFEAEQDAGTDASLTETTEDSGDGEQDLTEEEKAARTETCNKWENCQYANICMDEEKNVKNACFKDEPEMLAEITKTGETAEPAEHLPVCGNTDCPSYTPECFDHCAVSEPGSAVTECSDYKPEVAA